MRWIGIGLLAALVSALGVWFLVSGSLDGVVVDHLGNPLAGARVSIGADEVTTDNQGKFRLSARPGEVIVQINYFGFELAEEVTIPRGTTVETFTLPARNVTIKVLDDDGEPVPTAVVMVNEERRRAGTTGAASLTVPQGPTAGTSTLRNAEVAFVIPPGVKEMEITLPVAHGNPILYKSDWGTPPNWKQIEGTWTFAEGVIEGRSASWVQGRLLFGQPEWQNVVYEMDFTFLGADEPSRWAALMFGTETGQPPYWVFTLRQGTSRLNGVEIAYRKPDGNWDVKVVAPWKEDFAIGQPQRLRVAIWDGQVRAFINDRFILGFEDVKTNGNFLGLHTNGSHIRVENLRVSELNRATWAAFGRDAELANVVLEHRPLTVAHRGASSIAPENTIAAIEAAIAAKAEWVEIDIYMTRDREIVLLHDPTIDRTSNGSGNVNTMTFEQLRRFDYGRWFSPEFAGEKIPTLREALLTTKDRAIMLVEFKQAGIEREVVELVKELGMEDQVVYQSFNHASMGVIKALAPNTPAMILVGTPQFADDKRAAAQWMVQQARINRVDGIAVNYGHLTPELLTLAREHGLLVFAWTVNPTSLIRTVIETGVDGVITDYPQEMIPMLEKMTIKN